MVARFISLPLGVAKVKAVGKAIALSVPNLYPPLRHERGKALCNAVSFSQPRNEAMTETPDRLDRIEANLESASRTLAQVSTLVLENRRDIDQLSERVGNLTESLIDLRQSQNESNGELKKSISELRQGQAETKASIDLLVQTMTQFQQQAVADHAVILENQAEIRRIWEYLLSQHPNGRGGEG